MAKLSAHGAELARATLERETPDSDSTLWSRTERALMEDGTLLEKYSVRFRPTTSYDPPQGRLHTWGWKLRGKLRQGWDARGWAEKYRHAGWTVTMQASALA